MTETINTREVACNFDGDLATHVYPSGRKFGSERVYENMIKWLGREDQTPDRIAANGRWENLKTKVGWSSMHEEVLRKMKNYSTGHVYPTTDNLGGVIDQISDDFNARERVYYTHYSCHDRDEQLNGKRRISKKKRNQGRMSLLKTLI